MCAQTVSVLHICICKQTVVATSVNSFVTVKPRPICRFCLFFVCKFRLHPVLFRNSRRVDTMETINRHKDKETSGVKKLQHRLVNCFARPFKIVRNYILLLIGYLVLEWSIQCVLVCIKVGLRNTNASDILLEYKLSEQHTSLSLRIYNYHMSLFSF